MKNLNSIILLLMAAFGVYLGVGRGEFYPGRLGRKSAGKPLPKWFGRLWCFGFAMIAIYLGIKAWR